MKKISITAVTASLLFAASTLTAYGAGGGGGSGGFNSPSQSAPQIDPVAMYQKGIDAFQAGDYKQAERSFRKVLKVSSKEPNSNYLLGLSLIKQNQYKKARRPLEKAVKYDPSLILAKGYLGSIYQMLGKSKKAEKQRQELLALKSSCDKCENAEKIDLAIQTLDAEFEPQAFLESPQEQGLLNQEMGDHAYLEAVAKINRGEYLQALSSLSKSARAFGPHPDILTYQGFVNRKLGNKETALGFYQAALSIQPNHRGANEYLGEYFVETGQLELAKAQLRKLESICQFGCEEAEELRRWISAGTS